MALHDYGELLPRLDAAQIDKTPLQVIADKIPTLGELVVEISKNDLTIRKGMGCLVIKNLFLAPDRYYFAFEKNRYRQGDILQWQGEPYVGKQQIYDGEKDIQFEPNQGVSANLDRHQPKYTLSFASWIHFSGVPLNPTDG